MADDLPASPEQRSAIDRFRRALVPHLTPTIYGWLRRLGCLLAPLSYAARSGQIRSAVTGKVVDRRGQPLPWLTYPAIDFLESLDYSDRHVLEFGSGFSTLWWAARAESVTSFEADLGWLETMADRMPSNARVHPLPTDPDDRYHRTVGVSELLRDVLGDRRFDVIVIDGADRVGTATASLPYLADDGVVVVDNSDSHMLPTGTMPLLDVYRTAGMRRVDFYGQGPSILFPQCTSVAFRDGAFAFAGTQDTTWLKPFARRSYGNVEFQSAFRSVESARDASTR